MTVLLVLRGFLDAGQAALGTLDFAALGDTFVAEHTQLLGLRPVVAALGELDDLDDARSKLGVGTCVVIFLFRHRTPDDEQLANVLNWRGIELATEAGKDAFSVGAVVRKNPHLDQPVGIQCGVGRFDDGRGESIRAYHDHGVEMMGFGAFFLALGRGQLNRRHRRIIRAT